MPKPAQPNLPKRLGAIFASPNQGEIGKKDVILEQAHFSQAAGHKTNTVPTNKPAGIKTARNQSSLSDKSEKACSLCNHIQLIKVNRSNKAYSIVKKARAVVTVAKYKKINCLVFRNLEISNNEIIAVRTYNPCGVTCVQVLMFVVLNNRNAEAKTADLRPAFPSRKRHPM